MCAYPRDRKIIFSSHEAQSPAIPLARGLRCIVLDLRLVVAVDFKVDSSDNIVKSSRACQGSDDFLHRPTQHTSSRPHWTPRVPEIDTYEYTSNPRGSEVSPFSKEDSGLLGIGACDGDQPSQVAGDKSPQVATWL